MGCDRSYRGEPQHFEVSIHAPTWGATFCRWLPIRRHTFQSTHPHGVRPFDVIQEVSTKMFQSTHPHGVRLNKGRNNISIQSFNPRTHMGCDSKFLRKVKLCVVSIHAPTWGATESICCGRSTITVSIHAPTWGAT